MPTAAQQHRIRAGLTALALLACGTVQAAQWQALALGQPGPGSDSAFADAFHVTGALSRGGGRDVLMLRDVTPEAVGGALSAWPARTGALLYMSAATDETGALRLRGGTLRLQEVLDTLVAAGVRDVVLLMENCVSRDGTAARVAMPQAPEGLRLMLATTAAEGSECPGAGGRLTDRVLRADPSGSIQDAMAGLLLADTLDAPVPMTEQAVGAASPIIPAAAPPVQVVKNDVISLSPSVGATRSSAPLAPVPALARPDTTTGDGVLIFAAPPSSQIAALPRASGLPEPSIIVGLIEQATPASFDRVEDEGEVDANEIAYDNLAARRGLQTQDPDLFASLVEAGAFDPPQPLMARALQEELARMGCYTTGIDGVWGNGSRSAVQRYFAERDGIDPVTLEPEARLFRQIILKDDVACPAPQVSTRSPEPARASTGSTRTTSTQAARPRTTQAAPRQQPAPQTGNRRIQSGTALGVFR